VLDGDRHPVTAALPAGKEDLGDFSLGKGRNTAVFDAGSLGDTGTLRFQIRDPSTGDKVITDPVVRADLPETTPG